MVASTNGFADFEDFCKNIRKDFDIYCNIDHRKAKILKNKQRAKIKTHKQANDQTNKHTNKQRNKQKQRKQTRDVACFFFGPMQWLEPLRAAKRYK